MNLRICDKCRKVVWESDEYCECGRAYKDIPLLEVSTKGAYERYINGDYEKVSLNEIDDWLTEWDRKWMEKYWRE